jgi:hypothetical protein
MFFCEIFSFELLRVLRRLNYEITQLPKMDYVMHVVELCYFIVGSAKNFLHFKAGIFFFVARRLSGCARGRMTTLVV